MRAPEEKRMMVENQGTRVIVCREPWTIARGAVGAVAPGRLRSGQALARLCKNRTSRARARKTGMEW
jgi:hypothetical protein